MDHLAVSTQKMIVGKYVELFHLGTNVVQVRLIRNKIHTFKVKDVCSGCIHLSQLIFSFN